MRHSFVKSDDSDSLTVALLYRAILFLLLFFQRATSKNCSWSLFKKSIFEWKSDFPTLHFHTPIQLFSYPYSTIFIHLFNYFHTPIQLFSYPYSTIFIPIFNYLFVYCNTYSTEDLKNNYKCSRLYENFTWYISNCQLISPLSQTRSVNTLKYIKY